MSGSTHHDHRHSLDRPLSSFPNIDFLIDCMQVVHESRSCRVSVGHYWPQSCNMHLTVRSAAQAGPGRPERRRSILPDADMTAIFENDVVCERQSATTTKGGMVGHPFS